MKYISYVVTTLTYLLSDKLVARLLVNFKLANWYAESPGVSSNLLMELYRLISNSSTDTMEEDTTDLLVRILVNEKVPSIMTNELWKIVTNVPTGAFTGFCYNQGLDKLNPIYEVGLFKIFESLSGSRLDEVIDALRTNPAMASMHSVFTLSLAKAMVISEGDVDPDFLARLIENDSDSNR